MYGAGQIIGSALSAGGAKIKEVATIADRDALTGKVADGQVVRVRLAFQNDATVDQGWADYTYHKDGNPNTWEKTAEEEGFDETYYPGVSDNALSSKPLLGFPAGTPASVIKAAGITWKQIKDDEIFPTEHYQYTNPVAGLNNVTQIVEVGEVFNVQLTAGFTQNDAGIANRVIIKKNGVSLQDTATPALDYTYNDNGVVLSDGDLVQYQAEIYFDQGPEYTDVSGKGIPSPGRIEAGNVLSPVRTKTALRKIFFDKSANTPVNSADVRALSNVQWSNDYTFTINMIDGDSSITFAIPSNRAIQKVEFVGLLANEVTAEIMATESIISVEGGSPGYVQNYRVYHFQPESPYTASLYNITLKNA